MGFLDNIFNPGESSDKKKKAAPGAGKGNGGGSNNNTNNNNNNNPFANLVAGVVGNHTNPSTTRSFKGQGQSLGGSKPGEVIAIALPHPGPLGVRVEKKTNNDASAIVNQVVPGSQAEEAGLQRGDILCYAGSNGQEEIMYDMFLLLAKSDDRPIHLEVRRLTTQPGGAGSGTSISATTFNSSKHNNPSTSADTEVRRMAMIAAAEAREKAHKSKTKPIKYVTKTTLLSQQQQQQQQQSISAISNEPLTEASRIAATNAKHDESKLAAQLGYNPYEAAKSTAGQARTATTTVQHGVMGSSGPGTSSSSAPVSSRPTATSSGMPGVVSEPSNPATIAQENDSTSTTMATSSSQPNDDFELAYATVLSATDPVVSKNSISIMRKLIVNATTKGQIPPYYDNDENDASASSSSSSKFRKVRLGNPKIISSIVNVPGAIDLMLAVGFSLVEVDKEDSCLIYPAEYTGPEWLPNALKRMEG